MGRLAKGGKTVLLQHKALDIGVCLINRGRRAGKAKAGFDIVNQTKALAKHFTAQRCAIGLIAEGEQGERMGVKNKTVW